MRIGMLTQWFSPETGPASLPATYAREFVRQGHQVRVLTGYPNYPSGRIYEGYRQRVRSSSVVEGYNVTRVPLHPNHSASALGRVANYGSFALSAATLGTGALKGADALWVYNSPATVTAPLMLESRWGSVPYFLHVQDLWPESLVDSGMLPGGVTGRLAARAVRGIVRLAERRSSVIGVISPTVKDLILERDPSIDPARIVFAPNPADEQLFRPLEEIRFESGIAPDPRHFTVMYAGAIGEVQGLDTLLTAARALLDLPSVRFRLVGDGIARERLQERARTQGLHNVEFVGRVDQRAVPLAMAAADAQLVSLADADFLRYTMPSKISSILASGTPVVGQIAGDGAQLLEASGAAITVRPGNDQDLAEAISHMAHLPTERRVAMGRAGRAFYQEVLAATRVSRTIVESLGGAAA